MKVIFLEVMLTVAAGSVLPAFAGPQGGGWCEDKKKSCSCTKKDIGSSCCRSGLSLISQDATSSALILSLPDVAALTTTLMDAADQAGANITLAHALPKLSPRCGLNAFVALAAWQWRSQTN